MTAEAETEVKDICRWLYRQSESRAIASKWRDGLHKAIRSLAHHPTRCGRALEDSDFEREIRELLYGKRSGVYRILFTIEGDVVTVLHVRHAARRRLKPES